MLQEELLDLIARIEELELDALEDVQRRAYEDLLGMLRRLLQVL